MKLCNENNLNVTTPVTKQGDKCLYAADQLESLDYKKLFTENLCKLNFCKTFATKCLAWCQFHITLTI